MVKLAIIADDLTGALDAAAPFAMRGMSTSVALHPGALPRALASGAQIVSVSTHSREIAPEAASLVVANALATLPPGTRLFKKVDSRLKGNVAAELDAIPHQRSLTIAAIPQFGRFARDGQIQGFGVAQPIDIAGRLGRHAFHSSIPDVEEQADIEHAIDDNYDLLIGARGLAEAISRRMAPDAEQRAPTLPGSAAFCVIGSTDPITLAQLQNLREISEQHVEILAPNGTAQEAASGARLTILQAVPGATPISGKDVAQALGSSLLRLAPQADALLVLSGGATAQVILETLGIDVLDVLGEALPGLPIAKAGGLTVVTKSGGFGEVDYLSRLLSPYLHARSPVHAHVG